MRCNARLLRRDPGDSSGPLYGDVQKGRSGRGVQMEVTGLSTRIQLFDEHTAVLQPYDAQLAMKVFIGWLTAVVIIDRPAIL